MFIITYNEEKNIKRYLKSVSGIIGEFFVIQDGRIIGQGNHENLIALNGVYRKFHEL